MYQDVNGDYWDTALDRFTVANLLINYWRLIIDDVVSLDTIFLTTDCGFLPKEIVCNDMKGLVICVCKNIQIGDVSRVSLLIYNLDCNALSSIWKDF